MKSLRLPVVNSVKIASKLKLTFKGKSTSRANANLLPSLWIALLLISKPRLKLCIFAEGTSSDGLKVLPFKSSLFDIFTSFRKKSNEDVFLQPVSIFYKSPENKKRDFYGWWGVMPLFPHIILVLSNFRIAKVYISFNEIINASKIGERKELSRIVENSVRNSFNNSNDS